MPFQEAWPTFSPADSPLHTLIKLSRHYGCDPAMVLAGGGNTSFKDEDHLWVKASGHALATITADGFVEMDRKRLAELLATDLGKDPDEREARYKEAILAARTRPEKEQRPSVECLLHDLVPGKFVVHSHATLVNAFTCCGEGEQLVREACGDDVLWVRYVDPGFTLARELAGALEGYRARTGRDAPEAILMENHGLIVAGDTPDQIRSRTEHLLAVLGERLGEGWETGGLASPPTESATAELETDQVVARVAPLLRGLLSEPGEPLRVVTFDDSEVARALVGGDVGRKAATGGALTPDHIVYCTSCPLWFDLIAGEDDAALALRLRKALRSHAKAHRFPPRVVLVRGVGLFAAGESARAAATTRDLYLDAAKIFSGALVLGGLRYLGARERRFIEDWEVEAFRKSVARQSTVAGSPREGRVGPGRAAGKLVLVTGAARGFGWEIAQSFVEEGAHVALADVNRGGVEEAARSLAAKGDASDRVLGLAVDVSDERSVTDCVAALVRRWGGLDVLVSNAGVVRAGSVSEQSLEDFEFVTNVNYTGFFLCTRAVAPVMARQHRGRPDAFADVIQINSKSGLEGSSRNAAYAGSKFGGIGLTQSFALELVVDGIKVNAICPGNFLDGPLWSDPEKGLFVQYLHAGKVPGAKSVADVKRAYEEKVPMGRGCRTEDVMKAILYVIDQDYETGQAVPVTGGQVMLS